MRRAPTATFALTVFQGNNRGSWNTTAHRGSACLTTRSASETEPDDVRSSPATSRSNVDLPQPLRPSIPRQPDESTVIDQQCQYKAIVGESELSNLAKSLYALNQSVVFSKTPGLRRDERSGDWPSLEPSPRQRRSNITAEPNRV